ncbi:hypothetical protein PIB30_102518 [Stylosanthes scabra]|uniref:Uncharacterized protein n=1 Tax=Stylosanthes scabra TaxID=79078 RepID=A0ABU6YWQ8_9FABA|nr:hypothetical protein [Stylosanthes scabra]
MHIVTWFTIVSVAKIAENVMVNVGKLTIPTDLYIIRQTEGDKGGRPQVLLGRLFLKTARFKLQYDDDTFFLSVGKITEVFHVTRPPAPRKKGAHQLRVSSKKIEPEKLSRSEGRKESENPKNDGFLEKGLRIAPPQLKKKRKKVPLNLERKKEKKKKKQEQGKSEKKMMASKVKAPAKAPSTRVRGSTSQQQPPLEIQLYEAPAHEETAKILEERRALHECTIKFPKGEDTFEERILARGWEFMYEPSIPINLSWVREFYANRTKKDQREIFLRRKKISCFVSTIEKILNIPKLKGNCAYSKIFVAYNKNALNMDDVLKFIGKKGATW